MPALIEMSIRGLMVDPVTNMPIVILRDADNQRVLPIWVGPVEANSIALQIENVSSPRPMTHDLIVHLLRELGGTLNRVIIEDLKDNTFYAYLEIVANGEPLLLDVRPSDALAVALRAKARVFVHPRVLDHAKTIDITSDKADQERLQRWLESL